MKNKMEKEIRSLDFDVSTIRSNKETGVISGYAMVFNSLSKLIYGRFYEKILPEAMKGVVKKSDVLALLDHNRSRGVLARSRYGKGTLSLTTNSKGVLYEFTPPRTALGDETKEYLRRGDIQGSSFHFALADGGETWEKSSDGKYIRTITKFSELHDISLVFTPAYPETTAAVRSLAAWLHKQDPEKYPDLERLDFYYRDLKKQIFDLYYRDLKDQMNAFEVI